MSSAILNNEDIKFLADLAREMATENTLATARPVIWRAEEKRRVFGVCPKEADDIAYLLGGKDGSEPIATYALGEAKEVLIDTFGCSAEELQAVTNGNQLREFCEKAGILFQYSGCIEEVVYHGAFLTKKALDEHLRLNGHNYKGEITRYCEHVYRNPQLQRLLEIVGKFSDLAEAA